MVPALQQVDEQVTLLAPTLLPTAAVVVTVSIVAEAPGVEIAGQHHYIQQSLVTCSHQAQSACSVRPYPAFHSNNSIYIYIHTQDIQLFVYAMVRNVFR